MSAKLLRSVVAEHHVTIKNPLSLKMPRIKNPCRSFSRPRRDLFGGWEDSQSLVCMRHTCILISYHPLRVQVPNNHILTQNLYYNYYYPNPKYPIIGYMDPLGSIRRRHTKDAVRVPMGVSKSGEVHHVISQISYSLNS